jgi:hypothetical protein
MVNIHSKVIVLDPFGQNPVVMTGSHNLGFKASNANDDNLVIIQGNAPLAAAYAINIVAIYQTYRWNNYVELHRKDPRVWHGPVDNDQWQTGYLSGSELTELNFWMSGRPTAEATPLSSSAVAHPSQAIHGSVASGSGATKKTPSKKKGVAAGSKTRPRRPKVTTLSTPKTGTKAKKRHRRAA